MADITQQDNLRVVVNVTESGYTLSDEDKQLLRRAYIRGNIRNIEYTLKSATEEQITFPALIVVDEEELKIFLHNVDGTGSVNCGEFTTEDYQDTIPADE